MNNVVRQALVNQNKLYKKLWCFGDSWGAGAELKHGEGEVAFPVLLGRRFGCKVENHSKINHSLGLITRQVANHANMIESDHLVLVIVPPDSRWYTQWRGMSYNNRDFFEDKDDDWFIYHHQLFIFSICEMLDKTGCTYLLMHNYGQYPLRKTHYIMSEYHHGRFLDRKSLTTLLTNRFSDNLSPIDIETRAQKRPSDIFNGRFFQGCRDHPNQEGHEFIAKLIAERLKKCTNHKDQR